MRILLHRWHVDHERLRVTAQRVDEMDASRQSVSTKWSFHAMILASGQSAVESSSRDELLASIAGDPELTTPSQRSGQSATSYRIINRQEVEDGVRAMRVAEVRAEQEAIRSAAEAEAEAAAAAEAAIAEQQVGGNASAPGVAEPPPALASVDQAAAAADGGIDIGDVPKTPLAMALAFQQLVDLDKQFVLHNPPPSATGAGMVAPHDQDTDAAATMAATASSETGSCAAPGCPTRIFLLVDYPSSTAETHALLLLGEVGRGRPHQSSPDIPLLPLVDGVLLVADAMQELRQRRKSVSQTDERRKSITRRVSNDAEDAAALLDKQQSPLSVFQTAHPFVRDLYEMAAVGGLEWSDFVFLDLPCADAGGDVKPVAELASDLIKAMDPLVAQKAAFKDWVSTIKTSALPDYEPHSSDCAMALETQYHELLSRVFEPSVSVGAVVFAMREAVVYVHDEPQFHAVNDLDDCDNQTELAPEPFIDYGDDAALRLALRYDLFTRHAHHHRQQQQQSPCEPCCLQGQRIDQVDKMIWQVGDLPGVGNHGRKALPVVARLSASERSVLDTEYACFATIPVARVHLTRQLLRLEELLGQQWIGKLRTRNVTEDWIEAVLPQRLASILRDNPAVVKEYDEPTDSLLVAAITSTAPGRFRTTAWTAREHVRHRPALKDWHKELSVAEEYLTPRTALAATACVPLSAGQLGAIAEKCSIAYPADHSLIRLFQTPHAPAWLSVSLDGDLFGLRPQPRNGDAAATEKRFAMQFYANLQDGAQCCVYEGRQSPKKPDGHGSITVSHTSIDGLIVTVGSEGTVVQQQHHLRVVDGQDLRLVEKYRVISGKGAIVCVMADASRRILLSNGDVVVRRPVSPDEDASAANGDEEDETDDGDEDETLDRELVVDPETNALVERRRRTGVVVVTHSDGARVAYHSDGTCIYTTPSRSHVLLTKSGLADVCVDVDVNLAAQRHANGERVAVTKGGLRTRSVVRLRDGTELHAQYNTKVVAEVNGRIVLSRTDGTSIVAKDSGRVELTPRSTSSPTDTQTTRDDSDDADRDELSHNRVYYFNCRDGTLSLCDHEQNHFRVDVGDGRGLSSVNVALAGVLSESDADKYGVEPIPARAVINEPMEPHLFVLRGDGTGCELLRPRDVATFHASVERGSVLEMTHTAPTPPPPALRSTATEWWSTTAQWALERTFLRQVRPDPDEEEISKRLWMQDDRATACFERLKTPVATVYRMLSDACLPPLSTPENQFTVVRRLQHLRPMTSEHVREMLVTMNKWRQWQDVRESNKDRFKVSDPRSADVLAQEAAMQRKVLAAYKATRAKKKAERQKQREEQQRKSRAENGHNSNKGVHMETVQEGDEPHGGRHGEDDGDEDDDEFDTLFSEGSAEDSHSDMDVEVDDPDELMWTAFSEADTNGSGRLTLAQVRQALVQVMGVGVTTAELSSQLYAFRQTEPFAISFDVFADVVDAFRLATEGAPGDGDPPSPRVDGDNQSSDSFFFHKEASCSPSPPLAAGSAAEAVRSFSLLRLKSEPI